MQPLYGSVAIESLLAQPLYGAGDTFKLRSSNVTSFAKHFDEIVSWDVDVVCLQEVRLDAAGQLRQTQ